MSLSLRGFWNNKAVSGPTGASVPEIYPLTLQSMTFIKSDIYATYRKILTDCVERTHGISDKIQKHLWDNYVASEAPDGLISLLVEGMYNKGDVYIYYSSTLDVMRRATPKEKIQIQEDYATSGKSSVGAYISFRNFDTTDMLRTFSELEYGVLVGLHKSIKVSRALQLKMNDMRNSVSLTDSSVAIEQAEAIAQGLGRGDDVLMDKNDSIETSTPDVAPIERAISFIDSKRAYYLGFPISYISGIQTGGIGSTGEGDNRAIERGLKAFFYSILRPALLSVFGIDTTFKSSDFREIASGLEALRSFELVSSSTLSDTAKQEIIALLFNLDVEEEKKNKEREAKERGSSTTLNSSQVSAMSAFLAQLAAGQLAPDTAIQSLMVSFNLSREDAELIVEPMTDFRPRAVNQ